jgi:parvulin-like peptidyl-prolyl isomerase
MAQASVREAAGRSDARSVALVGEKPVALDDLSAQMAELAGAVALRELALDAALDRELAAANMRVGPAEAARERELLLTNLSEESRVSGDQAERLLERVRANRGLGPVRFEELLSRNAKLRALVRDDVVITPELLDREFALQTTARARIRLLLASGQRDAAIARERVLGAPAGLRSAAFAEEAIARSTDASAPAGGLVPAIHASDPAVPGAIRSALATLRPGDVSDVLAVEGGFAVGLLESDAPAAMSADGASRAVIERRLRGRLERLAMDALAERLVRESNVRVLDGSLGWSWESAQ